MNRNDQIRIEIMMQCFGARPNSRDAEHIVRLARREGEVRDVIASEIEREAAYLMGKGWLELAPCDLGQGNKRWAITASGVDFLEREGWV